MSWTHAGDALPWLRGQGVHVAAADTEVLVSAALAAAGFELCRTVHDQDAGRFGAPATALRLPITAADNLDAFADSLSELPSRWPGVRRLALLWTSAEQLIESDLLAWSAVFELLREANTALWSTAAGSGLVFETVAFVPSGRFGADRPPR